MDFGFHGLRQKRVTTGLSGSRWTRHHQLGLRACQFDPIGLLIGGIRRLASNALLERPYGVAPSSQANVRNWAGAAVGRQTLVCRSASECPRAHGFDGLPDNIGRQRVCGHVLFAPSVRKNHFRVVTPNSASVDASSQPRISMMTISAVRWPVNTALGDPGTMVRPVTAAAARAVSRFSGRLATISNSLAGLGPPGPLIGVRSVTCCPA